MLKRLAPILAIATLATAPTGIAHAATCRTIQGEGDRPHINLVRTSGIMCWHVTHPQRKDGAGAVYSSEHLGAYCETIIDCVDNWDVLSRAASKAYPFPTGLRVGQAHAFPPYRFHVTAQWHPCLIEGIYVGGCGHIRATPERWACSAVYSVIPSGQKGGGEPEGVKVTCRRGGAIVYVMFGDAAT